MKYFFFILVLMLQTFTSSICMEKLLQGALQSSCRRVPKRTPSECVERFTILMLEYEKAIEAIQKISPIHVATFPSLHKSLMKELQDELNTGDIEDRRKEYQTLLKYTQDKKLMNLIGSCLREILDYLHEDIMIRNEFARQQVKRNQMYAGRQALSEMRDILYQPETSHSPQCPTSISFTPTLPIAIPTKKLE